MKKCIKCHQYKLLESFYVHSQMKDGHIAKCKFCCRISTIWHNILSRCLDRDDKDYKSYGARGIDISPEWMNYNNFYTWYSNNYEEGCQIDRKNNKEGYRKENCQFVTSAKNCQNRRTTKLNSELLKKADKMYNDGARLYLIAKKLNINRTTLSSAFRGDSWKDFNFCEKVINHFRK